MKALFLFVDVHLIVAGDSNHSIVQRAGEASYFKLMSHGVKMHQWIDGNLHAKTAVVDRRWVSIGSYNLDYLSLLFNLEANIEVVSNQCGQELDTLFKRDLARCRPLTLQSWMNRTWRHKLASYLAYKLRRFL